MQKKNGALWAMVSSFSQCPGEASYQVPLFNEDKQNYANYALQKDTMYHYADTS